MSVFNYSHSGLWDLAKIFPSDGKHVTNSLIQFLIHCQYLYFYFMWSRTSVTVVKSKFVEASFHCKTHRISFFHPTSFFKPMSANILCISVTILWNIKIICAQAGVLG